MDAPEMLEVVPWWCAIQGANCAPGVVGETESPQWRTTGGAEARLPVALGVASLGEDVKQTRGWIVVQA